MAGETPFRGNNDDIQSSSVTTSWKLPMELATPQLERVGFEASFTSLLRELNGVLSAIEQPTPRGFDLELFPHPESPQLAATEFRDSPFRVQVAGQIGRDQHAAVRIRALKLIEKAGFSFAAIQFFFNSAFPGTKAELYPMPAWGVWDLRASRTLEGMHDDKATPFFTQEEDGQYGKVLREAIKEQITDSSKPPIVLEADKTTEKDIEMIFPSDGSRYNGLTALAEGNGSAILRVDSEAWKDEGVYNNRNHFKLLYFTGSPERVLQILQSGIALFKETDGYKASQRQQSE
ncbi:MAG: hypothetical protein HY428_03075 [Candidatus Levybacteria bacterium]|nr:hypothetical protein [Candidatus Levybacteria bacterium]